MNTQELKKLENNLWDAANQLRQGAGLKATEYASPILGLIFLKFADIKYRQYENEIQQEFIKKQGTRMARSIEEIAIEKCGFYLPDHTRYSYLRDLTESDNYAQKVKEAMQAVENGLSRDDFKNVLPQDEYFKIQTDKTLLKTLFKIFDDIPDDATGDVLGKIYEYFLGKFALSEGQGGGKFFTPTSVVKYMVEVIEPYHGNLFDPACGSGGMFVQSAQFIERHKAHYGDDSKAIYVTGQDKTGETVRLAKMNLLINGLKGEIREANTFTNDLDCIVFRQIDRAHRELSDEQVQNLAIISRLQQGQSNRYLELIDDYLKETQQTLPLIQQHYSALCQAFNDFYANFTDWAKHKHWDDEHKRLLADFDFKHLLDSLHLPVIDELNQPEQQAINALTDYAKAERSNSTQQHAFAECQSLIEHTRTVKKQLDKSYRTLEKLYKFADKNLKGKDDKRWKDNDLRDFKKLADLLNDFHEAVNPAMPLEFNNIEKSACYWLHQIEWLQQRFPDAVYEDVTGLCKLATLEEIAEQDYSLNAGRYVGVVIEEDGMTEDEFSEEILALHNQLQGLDTKASGLQQQINLNLNSFIND